MAKHPRCRALRISTGRRCTREGVRHGGTRCRKHVAIALDYKGKAGDVVDSDEIDEDKPVSDTGFSGSDSDTGHDGNDDDHHHRHNRNSVEGRVLGLNNRAREIVLEEVAGEELAHVTRARSLRRELAASVASKERIQTLERTVEALMDRAATQALINDRLATGQMVLLAKYLQADMGQQRLAEENSVLYKNVYWLWEENSSGAEIAADLQQKMAEAGVVAQARVAEKLGAVGKEVYETWGGDN